MPSVVAHPSQIVDGIRGGSSTAQNTDSSNTAHLPTASHSNPSPPSPSTLSASGASSSQAADVEPDDDDGVNARDMSALTSAERAALVISSSQISLDPELRIFTVNGTTEPRVVRLFPTTTCSCPAKADCYHVLAAQMAVGSTKVVRKRTLKLTQLRKNTRKRPDKTSGQKRPRQADVDVVPANDQRSAVSDACRH